MSLTREQWMRIWNRIKEIEDIVKYADELPLVKRQRIVNKLKPIKDDIQSIIGQME